LDERETIGLATVSAQEAAAALAASLPADQADVVLLRVVAGLDVDQVAEILGKKAGTVRVLQHKAVRRLAEKFCVELLTG
jgi:RNA polymerase sigma-70 factor (ECF subfamily)